MIKIIASTNWINSPTSTSPFSYICELQFCASLKALLIKDSPSNSANDEKQKSFAQTENFCVFEKRKTLFRIASRTHAQSSGGNMQIINSKRVWTKFQSLEKSSLRPIGKHCSRSPPHRRQFVCWHSCCAAIDRHFIDQILSLSEHKLLIVLIKS